jgi:hypothetical protein
MKTDRRLALASVLFIAGALVFVYAVANPDATYGNDAAAIGVFTAVMLLHFGTGILARRWVALLLPPIAVFLSVPAGVPAEAARTEAPPIWFGMLVVLEPLGLAALALGVLVAKIAEHRRDGRFRSISA